MFGSGMSEIIPLRDPISALTASVLIWRRETNNYFSLLPEVLGFCIFIICYLRNLQTANSKQELVKMTFSFLQARSRRQQSLVRTPQQKSPHEVTPFDLSPL